MAGPREALHMGRRLVKNNIPSKAVQPFARRWVATTPQRAPQSRSNSLSDLDDSSSFLTPPPSDKDIESFKAQHQKRREKQLPGNRYQYHPPKYYSGPLHPVQVPPSSDPTARNFVPGPFHVPRLRDTYESMIAPDLLTLTYTHHPPGVVQPVSQKGHLRQWDDSSPYHKNRPARGPRGGGSRLGLLEREIAWNNIPEISGVTISAFAPKASENKEYFHVARAVMQAITGQFPEAAVIRKNVVQWHIRSGEKAGAKTTLRGDAAYDFVDKLVTLVLPKIKDWPGIKGNTGDRAGNLAFGLEPDQMAYFPELEFNYDMYPAKLIPGCNIVIHTTGTSDRQGRLLLEAIGFPFYGKADY